WAFLNVRRLDEEASPSRERVRSRFVNEPTLCGGQSSSRCGGSRPLLCISSMRFETYELVMFGYLLLSLRAILAAVPRASSRSDRSTLSSLVSLAASTTSC